MRQVSLYFIGNTQRFLISSPETEEKWKNLLEWAVAEDRVGAVRISAGDASNVVLFIKRDTFLGWSFDEYTPDVAQQMLDLQKKAIDPDADQPWRAS